MFDHSPPPRGSHCMPNLCTPFSKFHHNKNSPSKKIKGTEKSKSNKYADDLQRLTSNDVPTKGTSKSRDLGLKKEKDYKNVEDDNINQISNLRYSYELGISGHEPRHSSPRSYYGTRSSIHGPFTRLPSLRRNASTKMYETPQSPSPLHRSSSHRSTDSAYFYRSASRSTSRNPIMFSDSTGMMRLPTMEMDLECTLEELCFGCVKKIKVTRDFLAENGQVFQEDEVLSVKVKPGWKAGTRVTFDGHGSNERIGTYASDVVFVIVEKEHTLFRRDGDDLEIAIEISLVDALCGCTIPIPLLGGDELSSTLDEEEIIQPDSQKIVSGQGMPLSVDPKERGNLRVVFLVDFPTELTDDQRLDIRRILQDSD